MDQPSNEERIKSLCRTVDVLKKRIVQLESVIAKHKSDALVQQRKKQIDESMRRFAERNNSFKMQD